MFRFIAFLQITPKFKRQLKLAATMSLGLTLGYWKGSIVNQQYANINDSKLTRYQNEDQISSLIQESKKPAVIYYYLAMNKDHCHFRQMMLKYSNLYPDNAIWTMVNIKQKFQQVKGTFDFQYPNRVMLEVRFPKSQVAIKLGQNAEFMQVKEKAHRRQPYNYNISDQGFRKFLQANRIVEGGDPVGKVLGVTKSALFGSLIKGQHKSQDKTS